MGNLDASLGEAERLYRQMRSLADRGDVDGKNEIVRLRSRYAMLKSEFERRFFEMRSKLAEHQAKWRLQAIEADTTGYMRSAQGLNSIQNDFYHWVGSSFSLH